MCKYGDSCYQTNPDHLNRFTHPPGKVKSKVREENEL